MERTVSMYLHSCTPETQSPDRSTSAQRYLRSQPTKEPILHHTMPSITPSTVATESCLTVQGNSLWTSVSQTSQGCKPVPECLSHQTQTGMQMRHEQPPLMHQVRSLWLFESLLSLELVLGFQSFRFQRQYSIGHHTPVPTTPLVTQVSKVKEGGIGLISLCIVYSPAPPPKKS